MGRVGVLSSLNLSERSDAFIKLGEFISGDRPCDLVLSAREDPNPVVAGIEVRVGRQFSTLELGTVELLEGGDIDLLGLLQANILRALQIAFGAVPDPSGNAGDAADRFGMGDVQLDGHEGAR